MYELLITLRAGQIIVHHAHNLAKGKTFFADHEFLSETYTSLENDYDSVIERIIGTKGTDGLELTLIMSDVTELLPDDMLNIEDNDQFFKIQLVLEKRICQQVEECVKEGYSQGIIQLLGDIAQRSEIRQYKVKQRLK